MSSKDAKKRAREAGERLRELIIEAMQDKIELGKIKGRKRDKRKVKDFFQ